jgi:DNA-binding transcriptional ArsR family regulator
VGPEADTVLDLEARRRIVTYVQDNPGIHLRAMAEGLRMPVSTLEYHCYQLTRHGRLATREDGGFKAFYPGQGMDRRDKDILYVVRHDVPRKICTHLVLNPGANPKDLKAVVGLSGPTLSFHLSKLRRSGIIREEPDGRTKRLFLEDLERVAGLLVTYRKSFVDDAVDRFAETWLSLRPPVAKPAPETAPKEGTNETPAKAVVPTPAPATSNGLKPSTPSANAPSATGPSQGIAPQPTTGTGRATSTIMPRRDDDD